MDLIENMPTDAWQSAVATLACMAFICFVFMYDVPTVMVATSIIASIMTGTWDPDFENALLDKNFDLPTLWQGTRIPLKNWLICSRKCAPKSIFAHGASKLPTQSKFCCRNPWNPISHRHRPGPDCNVCTDYLNWFLSGHPSTYLLSLSHISVR